MKLSFSLLALCLLLLAVPRFAAAQPSKADRAAAEALFNQGKALFDDGKLVEACAKFDASQKLDPSVGTLLFLGDCNEKQGKRATALDAFSRAAALAAETQDQRQKIADVRMAALNPQVSKLTVVVVDPAPGLILRRNGVQVPEEAWGAAKPLDAGSYEVEATAPGRVSWSGKIEVVDGGKSFTLTVPTLEDANKPAPLPPPPPPMPPPPPEENGIAGPAMTISGLALAGLGTVGIVVGSVFGVLAKNSNDESLEPQNCVENLCNQTGLDLRDEAKSRATVSTATFIVGGVLLAGGLTLFFLAPSDDEGGEDGGDVALDATFGPSQTGLSLRGTF